MSSVDQYDIAGRPDVNKLHAKAIGIIGVLFLTVTGAAPMSAMLGNVPFAAGYGVGVHTPAAFLLATIVLTIFSVGYAAMARKVSAVGGFYSFISRGISREVGNVGGVRFADVLQRLRSVAEWPLRLLRQFLAPVASRHQHSWLYLALFAIVLAGILSYFDVKLSVLVLGVRAYPGSADARYLRHRRLRRIVRHQCAGRGDQPLPRVPGCAGANRRDGEHRGGGSRRRHLHGLLVMGRL